jgi:flagellar basal body P-ring protein FlgI
MHNENTLVVEPKKQFVENIQKWVVLDKQLKLIHEKTKEIRENKNKITHDICNYIQNKNLTNTKIEISDGELKMYEKKEYSPLTFSYIEDSLSKIITDKSQINYIIQFLKQNREIKSSVDIRRTLHK